MNRRYTFLLLCLLSFGVKAQDFMLQGWYWDYPKTCNGFSWVDTLQSKVSQMSGKFTFLWLPPLSKASSGACSNGYDPRDLYDLGQYGGPTGFGTRAKLDALVASLSANGISPVADVVYNHRDGGRPEHNPAVRDYITVHYEDYKNPFPSDRFRCALPLGGASGNGAGNYYFKISSKTGSSRFFDKPYKVYMETKTVGWQNQPDAYESEPNGGGDCWEGNNTITLGRNWNAHVDAMGCKVDEFHLNLQSSHFNPAGDTLFIYLTNLNGDYSDHRIYGLWSANANADIVNQLIYQTWTDFTSMPSGQGAANFENFRPNSTNASTTWLEGDWDWLWFFYDVDQDIPSTQTMYTDWTRWLWTNAGIRGYRLDAVKHFPPDFVGLILDNLATGSPSIQPDMVVGEYLDTDPNKLKNWVNQVDAQKGASTAHIRAFDFSLRQALKDACDTYAYDVRNVFSAGMVDAAGASGFNVVTFVNNHDYRHAGEPIQNDPMLAYAYILTNNQVGLPCVFYPEYFGKAVPNYPNVYLKPQIDSLIQVHKDYIYQSDERSYLSKAGSGYSSTYHSGYPHTTLLYQLKGGIAGKDVLVCINFAGEPLDVDHTIDGSNFPVGTQFNKVAGSTTTPTFTVGSGYWVNLKVPARSYAVWVQGAVFPAELVHFDVERSGIQDVQLKWRSTSEANFYAYHIERSSDAKTFHTIGKVMAQGTAQRGADYTWTDEALPLGRTWYYRLRMEDQDGSVQYSPVRSIPLPAAEQLFRAWPNPFRERIFLQGLGTNETSLWVRLSDAYGRLVFANPLAEGPAAEPVQAITPGSLLAGVYWLQVTDGRQVLWQQKVVKAQ